MSAFAKVQTQIKDLGLLKQSLEDLGMKYSTGAKGVTFYGQAPQDIDVYVASHKLGFVQNANSTYDLVGDSDFQRNFDQVRQKYSENVARQLVRARGYKVSEVKTHADGRVTLVVKRQAYA